LTVVETQGQPLPFVIVMSMATPSGVAWVVNPKPALLIMRQS